MAETSAATSYPVEPVYREFQYNRNYQSLNTLVTSFLTQTGEFADTTSKVLRLKVTGELYFTSTDYVSGYGYGGNPMNYFYIDTSTSTREAEVYIDWSEVTVQTNFYTTEMYGGQFFSCALRHNLAANQAIHHSGLILNATQGNTSDYMRLVVTIARNDGAGKVYLHNCQLQGLAEEEAFSTISTIDNTGTGAIYLDHCFLSRKGPGYTIQNCGTGTVEIKDSEIGYYKANRGVYNKAGGEVALTGCTFVEDTDVDYYQGQSVYNESGLVNLEGCTVLAVTNQDRAELCNCRIKGGFENESYARLTHCDLSDTFHAKSGRAFFDNCRIFISEARSNFIAGIYVESAEASVHLSNSDIEVYNRGGSATAGAYGIFIYNMSNAVNYRDIYAQNCVITAGRASNSTAKSIGITDFNNFASSNYIRITLLGCKFPEPNWGVLGDNVSVGFPDEETTPRHPVMHVQGCKFSKAGIAIGSQYYTESTQATTYLPTGANLFNVVL